MPGEELAPVHLSLTGPSAGVRLCGASREEPAWHAMYLDPAAIVARRSARGVRLCERCCALWLEEEEVSNA